MLRLQTQLEQEKKELADEIDQLEKEEEARKNFSDRTKWRLDVATDPPDIARILDSAASECTDSNIKKLLKTTSDRLVAILERRQESRPSEGNGVSEKGSEK